MLDGYTLLASMYGIYPPETMPIYVFQHMVHNAYTDRQKKIEAINKGMIYQE